MTIATQKKANSKTTNPITNLESALSDGALAEEEITPFDTPVSIHIHSVRKLLMGQAVEPYTII